MIFKEFNKYGFNQWGWAYDSLLADKDTRQALMHFNNSTHQFKANKDQVCTLNYLFNIRDNKLNASVMMRSSDVYFGLPYDVPYFTLLQKCMLYLLKQNEGYENLKLGTYTHHSVSQHLYERNFNELEDSLAYRYNKRSVPEIGISPVDIVGTFTGYNNKIGKWINER